MFCSLLNSLSIGVNSTSSCKSFSILSWIQSLNPQISKYSQLPYLSNGLPRPAHNATIYLFWRFNHEFAPVLTRGTKGTKTREKTRSHSHLTKYKWQKQLPKAWSNDRRSACDQELKSSESRRKKRNSHWARSATEPCWYNSHSQWMIPLELPYVLFMWSVLICKFFIDETSNPQKCMQSYHCVVLFNRCVCCSACT